MTDAEKTRQLQNKAYNLKKSASGHQKSIDNIDNKLKKLRQAKEQLYDAYNGMKREKKKDQKICDAKYKWKGSWYSNDFKRDMHKMLDAENTYQVTVNKNIDKINNTISKLERERAKHRSIIKQLWAEITSVSRDLENLIN